MTLASRPATPADVRLWYPDMGPSMRARVCDMDGEPQGILGIALVRPYPCIFSAVNPPLRPHLKSITVMRMVKWLKSEVEARAVPVRALAEQGEEKAPALLERLGFSPIGEFEGSALYERRAQ